MLYERGSRGAGGGMQHQYLAWTWKQQGEVESRGNRKRIWIVVLGGLGPVSEVSSVRKLCLALSGLLDGSEKGFSTGVTKILSVLRTPCNIPDVKC
jgi:hypothetical protein